MMFSSNCFLCLFLVVLTTQAPLASSSDVVTSTGCPQAGLLLEKLVNLSTALSNINNSLISVFDLIDEQCPCLGCPQAGLLFEKLENLGAALKNISTCLDNALDLIDQQCPCLDDSLECFETRVSNFSSALVEFIDDVGSVTSSAPGECPNRTGTVFVATCDGTDVAVVDPNGVIQNGFNTDTDVTGWAVYINGDTYGFDYFRNDPFEVRCRLTPDGPEDVLGDDGDPPLTATAFGTGIVFDPDSSDDLVAITFNNSTLNGIYSFDRDVLGLIALRYSYDGNTGRIDVSNGYLYMNDGQEIIRRPLDGSGDWEQVHVFSASIKEFAVLCNGNIAFCDDAGAVYIYDAVDDVYKQTKKPVAGDCCASVEVNHCNGLIYVANVNDTEIEVYNATSRKLVDLLVYTESTPFQCPSIAFDPTFCCA